MGSPLRLTLPGSHRPFEADAAWAIVLDTFRTAEADLGRFAMDSALSRLNAGVGRPVVVPRTLARALAAAWRAYRMSAGRFDPRIIGALEAAGEHAGVALPASPARLGTDDRWLRLDSRAGHATVTAPVDLGGIGKGLALRWSAAALRAAGIDAFLVQAGGDIVAAGRGPADRPWVVRIEDPTATGEEITMRLGDGAVATSSVAVRRWLGEDGSVRHHLIDPSTLRPATPTWVSVTVTHADPAWAEVLSKVGFLAGGRIGSVLAGRPAWWRGADGRLHGSAPHGTPPAPWYASSWTGSTRRIAEDA
jgi:thiamine biosynthesis lipoprotein